ncbi:hypothetical protein [Tissierella creatinophila]|uniref:Uncharacterized protein n=1 Tax=Tissierella creatinophila DSM 6911 TaxID=1123403 RepID=A0A1U7M5J9_TISCR|nr:hypothetical protein [Tissierella creatinophila]OLS02530.1 hypothetical protein TICRE_14860 [Tissierella creatinophila DSM 6911]
MNEKTLLVLLLLLNKNKNSKLQTSTEFVKDYVKSLEVNPTYTLEKIHIAENISPYIPEEFSPSFEKAIMISKGIVKVEELKEFANMQNIKSNKTIHFDNNTERLRKIVSVVQDETSKDNIKNMGIIMDLVLNIDKYKKMYSVLNNFMKNVDSTNGIEDILKIVSPLLGDNSSDNKQDKSVEKMLDIVKLLNSQKTNPNQDKTNEG